MKTLVVIEYPMLYTKFQGHWPLGSKEEDFFKFFTIYGHSHVVWNICLFVLRLNVPVNNFSVMSRRSHRFLGN